MDRRGDAECVIARQKTEHSDVDLVNVGRTAVKSTVVGLPIRWKVSTPLRENGYR